MKSPANRRPTRRMPAFQSACARTFGATFAVPRAGRRLTIAIAVMAVLATGAAAAAWQVNDNNTQREIRDLKGSLESRLGGGNITDKLTDVNRKLEMTQRSGTTIEEMVKEPENDEALNATQPLSTMQNMDRLCVPGANSQLGQQQQTLCQELIKTELAQYRFSLRMFERAKENYDKLKDIQKRRNDLAADDYANVQYNTNELLALTARMDNDRDRYDTYMAAYNARIAHIQTTRSALTRNALKGTGSVNMSLPSF